MLISMGIIIAGLAILVYGIVTKAGNEFMIKGAIYSSVYVMIILFSAYILMKAKKTDIELDITKNSISTAGEKPNNA